MTLKDLDVMIREIIIPQTKPISTGNSYFRKMGEKRRWGRLIRSELLRNPARYFYNHLASQISSWAVGNYGYVYFYFYGQSGRVEDVEVVELIAYKFKKMHIDFDKLIAVAKGVIKWQLQ